MGALTRSITLEVRVNGITTHVLAHLPARSKRQVWAFVSDAVDHLDRNPPLKVLKRDEASGRTRIINLLIDQPGMTMKEILLAIPGVYKNSGVATTAIQNLVREGKLTQDGNNDRRKYPQGARFYAVVEHGLGTQAKSA